jgi:hypothetical protein
MKRTLMWGAQRQMDVTYSGSTKTEKAVLVDPASIGSKPDAQAWAEQHNAKLVRVAVMR